MKAATPPSRVLSVALIATVLLAPGLSTPRAAEDSSGASSAGASPGPSPSPSPGSLHPHGFAQIGLDARYLATRPFHLDRSGWTKVAATLATLGALYAGRGEIRDWSQDHRRESWDRFLQKPRVMGKGAFAPSAALIAYTSSFVTQDDREKETAVLLLESMAFTGLVAGIGRFVLATDRPEVGNDVHFFRGNGHGVSGDAALAASVVPILRNQYLRIDPDDGGGMRFWKRAAAGILYAGAFLTGYQRINNDKHYAPDVFLGLVSGFTVGQLLCDSHDRSRDAGPRSRLTLGPVPGGIGLSLSFSGGQGAPALDTAGTPR
ncbi:MAG TPA: phosphatase PAP2 family protein [Candidatus Polarisedimenticolia bacterium]|jgi:hypothetical protein|nr:phosphatase PAP2 family protein [Candidatus Polarisedimenticolia bacterium]